MISRVKLMIHFSKSACGRSWFWKHQDPTSLLRVSQVFLCLFTLNHDHLKTGLFLEPERALFLLAPIPPPCPSTLSSNTPNFLHFLEFSIHFLISSPSHILFPFLGIILPSLAPGELLCNRHGPLTYHLLLEDFSDTPRYFHYPPPANLYIFICNI